MAVSTTYSTAGSGLWLCPVGVTSVQAECWGGGGGGQQTSASTGGRGGGGGEYALDTVGVTPGRLYAWNVASAAGNSTFAGDTLTVRGHGGKSGSTGGSGGTGSINATHFDGGSGGRGASRGGGGGGSSAGTAAAGNNGSDSPGNFGGAGGTAPAGGGSGGEGAGALFPFASSPGTAPGGGGGAGAGSLEPGASGGAHGQVRLTYDLTAQPVIPYFPAGYAPLHSDFDGWIQAPLAFLTSRVVFRAELSNALSLTNNVNTLIPFNNVLEDPFSGWNPGASQWLCPAGYGGLYNVTLTVSAQSNSSNPVLESRIGIDSAAYLYTVCKTVTPNGGPAGLASGSQPVQLFGGADSVQGYAIVIGASGAVATNAGQRCTLTIEWSAL
ncbi:MAG TPA: hypothetical protein VMV92_13210 [Streptosporangiaceae bacterium]|nr:hypothetical protein [Streptosporangiaceae bacterium]